MRELYPEIEPYRTDRLKVSPVHELYIEESGSPHGDPVVFVHGGPGGGTGPKNRRYFDPKHYRIILFDQRGAGQSTPHADLTDNTTWHLVDDMEKIRSHLGIDRWHVFGGSWGSTLSLAYAETHPDRVKSLCLRGIFLCRKKEIQWFYQEGASVIYPDAFEPYREFIPPGERGDMVKAYYRRLTSDDEKTRLEAARLWSVWEGSTSKLIQDQNMMHDYSDPYFALAFARIECHYFINNAFFASDNWLIENAGNLKGVPTEIVHGRYDVVCPVENAWDLKKVMPHAELHIVQDAGHSATEPGISSCLVEIMDRFKKVK